MRQAIELIREGFFTVMTGVGLVIGAIALKLGLYFAAVHFPLATLTVCGIVLFLAVCWIVGYIREY